MRKKLALLLAVVTTSGLFASFGCYEDPNDPETWIKKLKDPREQEDAATKLMELKNLPGAAEKSVPALIDTYESTRDPRYLDDALSFHNKLEIPELVKILSGWNASQSSTEAVAAAKSASQECITTPDPKEAQALIHVVDTMLPPTGPLNFVKLNAIDALALIKDRSAVPALRKVLDADFTQQPIILAAHAAITLGKIGDPDAVPSLVTGLFKAGGEQGETNTYIFPECKMALIRIGEPAVPALEDLMDGKNAEVEQMAKDQGWDKNPDAMDADVWKAEMVLGDMHAESAVPKILANLAGKQEGHVQEYALYALGKIGDPSSLDAVMKFAADMTRPIPDRIRADQALVMFMDQRAAPTLLANLKNADGNDALQADAAIDYVRLVGPDADKNVIQTVHDEVIPDVQATVDQAAAEAGFAIGCKSDPTCYVKAFEDQSQTSNLDIALFQLVRLKDTAALPGILKVLPLRDPRTLRDASLFAIEHLAPRGDATVLKALNAVISTESQEKGLNDLVEKTEITEAYLERGV